MKGTVKWFNNLTTKKVTDSSLMRQAMTFSYITQV